MPTESVNEVFVFSEVNYRREECTNIKPNKPYLLIEKKDTIDNGFAKETSYFYALDDELKVDTSKIYKANTNWWHTDASFKNARIMGEIKSRIVFEEMIPFKDY